MENKRLYPVTKEQDKSYKDLAESSLRLCRKILYKWRVSMITDLLFMILWFLLGLLIGLSLR